MAELTTLARPYAKAAFEYALAAKDLKTWSDMLAMAAAVTQEPAVQTLMSSPTLTAADKAQTLIEVCGEDLNDKGRNFIGNLAGNKRLALLPQISVLFDLMKEEQEKSVEVSVTTAFELSPEQSDKLAKALSAKLEREVDLQSSVDTNLLGGVVVRAGDTVIDGSVRGRLAKLAEAMNS